jgi:hypothetical protein
MTNYRIINRYRPAIAINQSKPYRPIDNQPEGCASNLATRTTVLLLSALATSRFFFWRPSQDYSSEAAWSSKISKQHSSTFGMLSKHTAQGPFMSALLEYLDRVLPHLSFMQAWDKIIEIVSNVVNGLNSLHKRKIIHR